jgi:hypothetical protein
MKTLVDVALVKLVRNIDGEVVNRNLLRRVNDYAFTDLGDRAIRESVISGATEQAKELHALVLSNGGPSEVEVLVSRPFLPKK